MSRLARMFKLLLLASTFCSLGAVYRTPNFVVHAANDQIAKKVALAAEHYRRELAVEWLGHEMKTWWKPCPVYVKTGQIGAGGATSFSFDRGQVFGWRMNVQGSLERILDSVLPHEITHTILACHFRRPLPRWADEGAATLCEHESERRRQRLLVERLLRTSKRIPLRRLLAITEYPQDMEHVLSLYAQGYSLADYLVQQGGRARYLKFLEDALRDGWETALKRHYGFDGVDALESRWGAWVMAGSPPLNGDAGVQLAESDREGGKAVVRGQSPGKDRIAPATQPPRPSAGKTGRTGESPANSTAVAVREPRRSLESAWVPVDRSRLVEPVLRRSVGSDAIMRRDVSKASP